MSHDVDFDEFDEGLYDAICDYYSKNLKRANQTQIERLAQL